MAKSNKGKSDSDVAEKPKDTSLPITQSPKGMQDLLATLMAGMIASDMEMLRSLHRRCRPRSRR